MSSKRVEQLSHEASASFWDMVCAALMSSDQVSMNRTKIQSSRLILPGSRHAKPGGWSHSVCPDCDSGTSSMCTQQWRWTFKHHFGVWANVWFGQPFGVHEV